MAKIRAGILSTTSGKVAGVVGGTWKGINYIREYVIPANPKTAGQVAQRDKFSACVDFEKPLIGQIFNVYTDKFQKAMSGYNYFMKRNIAHFTPTIDYPSIKTTEGKLFTAGISGMSAVAATNTVTFNSDPAKGANGEDDDQMFAMAYNVDQNIWGFSAAPYDRIDGVSAQTVTLEMDGSDTIQMYLLASQYIGTVLDIISDSDHDSAVAA